MNAIDASAQGAAEALTGRALELAVAKALDWQPAERHGVWFNWDHFAPHYLSDPAAEKALMEAVRQRWFGVTVNLWQSGVCDAEITIQGYGCVGRQSDTPDDTATALCRAFLAACNAEAAGREGGGA